MWSSLWTDYEQLKVWQHLKAFTTCCQWFCHHKRPSSVCLCLGDKDHRPEGDKKTSLEEEEKMGASLDNWCTFSNTCFSLYLFSSRFLLNMHEGEVITIYSSMTSYVTTSSSKTERLRITQEDSCKWSLWTAFLWLQDPTSPGLCVQCMPIIKTRVIRNFDKDQGKNTVQQECKL